MTEILQELGPLDVLILNAAVAHRREQATNVTAEEMQDAFDVNVLAAFSLSKAYLAMPMPEAGIKTILNVSTAAVHIPTSLRVGYG
jgi:NAD(P)-dependent dehydrogenase (short-subunit alcohol dehydrogenase family)